MRLAFVVQAYGEEVVGGAESACRDLARSSSRFADVTVLTSCAASSVTWSNFYPSGESHDAEVRVLRFPVTAERSSHTDRGGARLFSKASPSLRAQRRWIELQGPKTPELIDEIRNTADDYDGWIFYTYLYYPTLFGLPLVSERAVLHPTIHDEPPAYLPIVRSAIHSARGLWLHSQVELATLIRIAGWPSSSMYVGGSAVEAGSGDVGAFRANFGIGDVPYALYLGRVDRGKGIDLMTEGFSRFKQATGSGMKLVIAGPVVHDPSQAPDTVVTGKLTDDQRWAALEGCSVLIHPSPLESFGLVLIEAWLKEKPAVVNSASGVLASHAERSRAALEFSDADALAALLHAIEGDPKAASELGKRGRRFASRFTREAISQRYEAFLRTALDLPGG